MVAHGASHPQGKIQFSLHRTFSFMPPANLSSQAKPRANTQSSVGKMVNFGTKVQCDGHARASLGKRSSKYTGRLPNCVAQSCDWQMARSNR